jgi:hypothetical protein
MTGGGLEVEVEGKNLKPRRHGKYLMLFIAAYSFRPLKFFAYVPGFSKMSPHSLGRIMLD